MLSIFFMPLLMNSFITFLIAHWDLTAATLLIVALIIFFEIREHAHGISHLSTQEALHMINRENALVLDVRDEKLFSEGHILKAQKTSDHFSLQCRNSIGESR